MNMLKRFLNFIILFFLLGATVQAATITYETTHIGGTQWRYDYRVSNDILPTPIEEFSIFFSNGLYANLLDVSTASGWNILVIPPDSAIPASGFLDALAMAGGVFPSATESGFSIAFDYLGSGTPGSQDFSIVDPTSFDQLCGGNTSMLVAVPIPSMVWLLIAGLPLLLWWGRGNIFSNVSVSRSFQ